jgi:ribonuclease HII
MLKSFFREGIIEAGCDEAGRGCLAGPVYAAAVILPPDYQHPLINDSKQLCAREREALRVEIERDAISWAIGIATVEEIDEINILRASFLAMHRAVKKLRPVPQHLIIDGNRFDKYRGIEHTCIIQGDGQYLSIAAASILAKTYRDDFMRKIHRKNPCYKWSANKGYPTPEHREALRQNGASIWHRMSFHLFEEQLELIFESEDEARQAETDQALPEYQS